MWNRPRRRLSGNCLKSEMETVVARRPSYASKSQPQLLQLKLLPYINTCLIVGHRDNLISALDASHFYILRCYESYKLWWIHWPKRKKFQSKFLKRLPKFLCSNNLFFEFINYLLIMLINLTTGNAGLKLHHGSIMAPSYCGNVV